MEIAYKAGQVTRKVALSKDWYNCPIQMFDVKGNEILPDHVKELDDHKFNQLFSEDLY